MSQRILQKPKRRRLDYRQDPCRDVFTCRVCGWPVGPQAAGTQHRNHCPNCLASVHLDDEPGDRAADCGGTMEPVAVWVRKGGEWAIIHRCKICGVLHSNRVAADDNPMLLMSLAVKPLAAPPFPWTGWSGRRSKNLKNRRRLYGLRRFFYATCLKFPQVSLTLETQAKVSGKRARISWNRTT